MFISYRQIEKSLLDAYASLLIAFRRMLANSEKGGQYFEKRFISIGLYAML